MGERKVLNKYYPPDFDATKLKKNHRPKDKQDVVRMMLPMTIRCNTCGNYLYIGTKFNMRKETALNEEYLGIKIYRFYFKCTVCYAELTFKTDPKNHDYVVEHGGSRNYEPWRDAQSAETLMKEIREKEEEGNAMKYLENKTYDSKREMEMLDALDEIKELNKRKAKITVDQLLEGVILDNEKQEQEDREISKLVFKERTTKRLIENNDDTELVPESKSLFQGSTNVLSQQQGKSSASSAGKLIPRHLVVRSKNVCKDEKPSLNLLRAKGIVPQMEVLTIESSGESHSGSLQSHTQLTNKMASLLNYSDDE